jgi:hypothetical protein
LKFEDTQKEVKEIVDELSKFRSAKALLKHEDGPQIIALINEILYGPVEKLRIRSDRPPE